MFCLHIAIAIYNKNAYAFLKTETHTLVHAWCIYMCGKCIFKFSVNAPSAMSARYINMQLCVCLNLALCIVIFTTYGYMHTRVSNFVLYKH